MKNRWLLLIPLLLAMAIPVLAQERVVDFASTVFIQQDGELLVTENITVDAEGRQIKRGIVREFPTRYTDKQGRMVRVGFELLSVKRDGHAEPYHTKSMRNGIAIYAGKSDVLLRHGRTMYTIEYRTTRQLGFFADHDELYWNVNGNGWRLPLDKVSCDVILPSGAIATEGWEYEGVRGSKDGRRVEGGDFRIHFASSHAYAPGEGLTIAVSWPRGFVTPPGAIDRTLAVLSARGSLVPASLGGGLLLLYFLLAWLKVGRDPARGVVIPRFAPPKGFSPAMVRMLWKMHFDNTAYTAGIINMAVQGGLKINEQDKTALELSDQAPRSLSAGERAAWNELRLGGERIQLERSNYRILNRAQQAMKDKLSRELASTYFLTNSLWMVPGLAITLLAIGGIAYLANDPEQVLFMSVWLTGWTFGCVILVRQALISWQAHGVMGIVGAMVKTLLALPFLAGEIVGLGLLIRQIGLAAGIVFIGIIGMNALFYELLKAPTRVGRAILDEIEGFKLYLSVAEKDRLNFIHPPEETPELFEQFLPYAIALGVENQWGARFANVLSQAGYAPEWYQGRRWNRLHPSSFASDLGSSMQSDISSASMAPGSSSGMGGGGCSGGGGGGGGGGGW